MKASYFFTILFLTACMATATLLPASLSAQTSQETAKGVFDGDLFHGLKARLVGPAGMSGRIAAVDSVASDTNIIVGGF